MIGDNVCADVFDKDTMPLLCVGERLVVTALEGEGALTFEALRFEHRRAQSRGIGISFRDSGDLDL